MSSTGGNEAPNSINGGTVSSKKKMCVFYVVIPPEDQALSKDASKAVSTFEELLAILKRNPHARFQSGNTVEDAKRKALLKKQCIQDRESISLPPPRKRLALSPSSTHLDEYFTPPPTSSPKAEELLTMGQEIVTNQNEKVLERIKRNARILCTDSEFPTILQEGCKLNAMHLAAKSNNYVVMKHILNLVSSVKFMQRIYPFQTEERLRMSSKHLTGSYLNTPDKMLQESPLHFACKFSAFECVELLLSHPFCDTSLKNSEQNTAFQVIGQRAEADEKTVAAIKELFSRRFIVPIWRDVSVEGDPPVLGDVSFIHDLGQAIPPPLLHYKFPDFSLSLLEPCKSALLPKTLQKSTIKVFSSHSQSSQAWKIMAFAGPIGKSRAEEFRKVMKRSRLFLQKNYYMSPDSWNATAHHKFIFASPPSTPPPSSQFLLSPLNSPLSVRSLCDSPSATFSRFRTDMATRVRDVEKGLERVASEYAREMDIPWSEYYKFLDRFCDLTSSEGLSLFENYFRSLSKTDKKDVKFL